MTKRIFTAVLSFVCGAPDCKRNLQSTGVGVLECDGCGLIYTVSIDDVFTWETDPA